MERIYSYQDLFSFVANSLEVAGFTKLSAEKISENLITSQMMGYNSHGITRVAYYGDNLRNKDICDTDKMVVLSESPSHLWINANGSLSFVYFPLLIDRILEKADTQAITTLSISHFSHIGRLGAWTQRIADKGYMVLLVCNDNGFKAVAPFGGTSACLSTNPIAFACPYDEDRIFSLDMATSAVSYGKVRHYHYQNQKCPLYWVQDANGKTVDNPTVMFSEPVGTLMPLGGEQGYKGTSLGMMVDILSAALSGGDFPNKSTAPNGLNNVSMTIWNPKYFAGVESVRQTTKDYIEFIQKSPTVDGNTVRVGGQNSWKNYQKSLKEGITITDEMISLIESKVKAWRL